MAESTKQTEPKKSKTRSPNHPLLSLEKAIELAATIEKTYGTHDVPLNLAHKQWKYKEWSSVADQCIAALKSYGLIKISGKGKSRKLALTEAGSRISRGAPDKDALVRTAFMAPAVHREIIEHFGAKGLPNDALLEQYLVWERPEGQRFNQDTVGAFIERFRKSLEFSKATVSDIIGTSPDDEDQSDDSENGGGDGGESDEDYTPPAPRKRRPMQAGMNEDVFSLAEGAIVLQWPGRLSKVIAADAQDWLELIGRKIKRAAEAPPDDSGATEGDDENE